MLNIRRKIWRRFLLAIWNQTEPGIVKSWVKYEFVWSVSTLIPTKSHISIIYLPARLNQKVFWNKTSILTQCKPHNKRKRTQSVKFLGPKISAIVPQNIKNCKSFQEFKRLMKVWKPEDYPCWMCKKYVANIGFIWLNIHLS